MVCHLIAPNHYLNQRNKRGTNVSEISIEIDSLSKEVHLNMSSANWHFVSASMYKIISQPLPKHNQTNTRKCEPVNKYLDVYILLIAWLIESKLAKFDGKPDMNIYQWWNHKSKVCKDNNLIRFNDRPTGDAPTTSEWSTILLPTKELLILEVWLGQIPWELL